MLSRWFGRGRRGDSPQGLAVAPCDARASQVESGGARLDLAANAEWHEGLPFPDWASVHGWVDGLDAGLRGEAWLACERGWLAWLGSCLGPGYRLYESDSALLLSAQPERYAGLAASYMATTARRVCAALEELAGDAELGKDILIVLADQDSYYRFISRLYPDEGEWGMSSGMHVSDGCQYFLTWQDDLRQMEPVIAHEMTHGFLAHLPLPTWLNEGIAVNTEYRLAGGGPVAWQAQELLDRHRGYWTPDSIQAFWSGAAFLRPDQAQELAYDLGRVMVGALAQDWAAFKRFVLAADRSDAGQAAALAQLDLDLGDCVSSLLDGRESPALGPRPVCWASE